MKKIIIANILSFLLFSCSNQYQAQATNPLLPSVKSASVTNNQDKVTQIDTLLNKLNKENQFNGSVAIVNKGKLLYKKSIGFANFNNKKIFNEDDSSNLASCSKQFTAFAIMTLKERNKLNYDDKLIKYFPELKLYPNVTIRHLLNQVSGIPDYLSNETYQNYWVKEFKNWNQERFVKNKDVFEMIVKYKAKPLFNPGEKHDYSNTNSVLLVSLVEKILGITFQEFMSKNVFLPLGMNKSFVLNADKPVRDRVLGYEFTDGSYQLDDLTIFDGVVGDGNIYVSINDFLKWEQSLYTEKIIKQSTLQEAFKPALLNDGTYSDYGFGWVSKEGFVWHNGSWAGFRSFIMHDYKEKSAVLIINNTRSDVDLIANELVKILKQ